VRETDLTLSVFPSQSEVFRTYRFPQQDFDDYVGLLLDFLDGETLIGDEVDSEVLKLRRYAL
jgi:hypothetical protein